MLEGVPFKRPLQWRCWQRTPPGPGQGLLFFCKFLPCTLGRPLVHPKGTLLELYWSSKGALKDEFLDFMLFRFSSVLATKSFQNGLKSGPGGAPGCPGGGPGGPGGGSDVQMSI